MTVAEAMKCVKQIERLQDNIRKLNQYFLNLDTEEIENIANEYDIGIPISNMLSETKLILEHLAVRCQTEIMETQLPETSSDKLTPFDLSHIR